MSGNPNGEAGKVTGRAAPGAVAAVDPPGSNKTTALDTPKSATGSRRLARSGQGRHKEPRTAYRPILGRLPWSSVLENRLHLEPGRVQRGADLPLVVLVQPHVGVPALVLDRQPVLAPRREQRQRREEYGRLPPRARSGLSILDGEERAGRTLERGKCDSRAWGQVKEFPIEVPF